jgi:hypothetical protein
MSGEPTTTPPVEQEAAPDWWQSELSNVRQEAASTRVKLKETKEALEAEKAAIAAEKAQVASDLEKERIGNLKLKAALRAKVPGELAEKFAEILVGTDLESLVTHAESLKETFAGFNKSDAPVDHSQGAGSDTSLNGDPLLEDLRKKLGF